MTPNKFDLLGPALNDVGREAVRLTGGEPDGIFLYVEIGDGWVRPSLYKIGGLTVTYVDPGRSPLDDLIIDAWCLEPADKRWTSMQMNIHEGKFSAKFDFDDIEHSKEHINDRRQRVLHARFGDKPIVYPPLRRDGWTLKPPA